MAGYYLLDHPNPNAPRRSNGRRGWYYPPPRRQRIRLGVLHTAENLPDLEAPDGGAEAVARYFASVKRATSAHVNVDSDSTVLLLPDDYTAFHVRGYNSPSVGLEVCTRAASWAAMVRDHPEWVDAVVRRAADVVAGWHARHGIPLVRLSRREVDAGRAGLVAHADLDPARRSDPGRAFPWDRMIEYAKGGPAAGSDDEVTLKRGSKGRAVALFQRALQAEEAAQGHPDPLPRFGADGDYGDETVAAVKAYQRAAQVPETGEIDGVTAALLVRYVD